MYTSAGLIRHNRAPRVTTRCHCRHRGCSSSLRWTEVYVGTARLVECGSELMVLGFTDVSLAHLVVYRVSDLTKGRVAPLTSIGEHAIFSEVHALCISAKRFPSILGNSIICKNRSSRMVETHDFNPLLGRRAVRPAHPLVEQYDLGSDTWSPAIDEDIVHSDRTPASPYTLAHHIFTCCCRYYW